MMSRRPWRASCALWRRKCPWARYVFGSNNFTYDAPMNVPTHPLAGRYNECLNECLQSSHPSEAH
eukprot:1140631-Pelagomonas_calceolata.AAC.5